MSVSENLKYICESIRKTAQQYGRDPDSVRLIAVSKTQGDDKIMAALDAGQRIFGENRVQEAQLRWTDRRKDHNDLELHLIGPLQTNKVKDAVALFDVIHTLDREKLALKLASEMQTQNRHLPCLIQVNTGAEDQKSGVLPASLPDFLKFCRNECGLNIVGLMCIPPVDDPPALHFALLRKLAAAHNLPQLSMGMSADYEWAVGLDATYIRIGTGIFGDRTAQ